MKLLTWAFALLLTAAVSACSTTGTPHASASRDPSDGRLMPPEKVAEHVWLMRQPERLWAVVIGNVVIIEQRDGVVLVDSGGSIPDGRDVVAAVAGLTKKPIKAIAVTHWHNDHPLGIPGVLETFPSARVISTAATREYIRSETKVGIGQPDADLNAKRRAWADEAIELFTRESADPANAGDLRAHYALEARWISQRAERQIGSYAVLPTEVVSDRLVIDDPEVPVELLHFGAANTRGDLIAWLPRQKVVATGDAVVAPTPYGFDVSIQPWLQTLQRIEQLSFATLIPGHGKAQHDADYLHTLQWSMKDIGDRAKAAAARGVAKEDAFAAFDPTPHEARFRVSGAWAKKWLNDYWLEGMFATAYDEAKGVAAPGK